MKDNARTEDLRRILVPHVVSQVNISWGSYLTLRAPRGELSSLVNWCKANLYGSIGYCIEPMEEIK